MNWDTFLQIYTGDKFQIYGTLKFRDQQLKITISEQIKQHANQQPAREVFNQISNSKFILEFVTHV